MRIIVFFSPQSNKSPTKTATRHTVERSFRNQRVRHIFCKRTPPLSSHKFNCVHWGYKFLWISAVLPVSWVTVLRLVELKPRTPVRKFLKILQCFFLKFTWWSTTKFSLSLMKKEAKVYLSKMLFLLWNSKNIHFYHMKKAFMSPAPRAIPESTCCKVKSDSLQNFRGNFLAMYWHSLQGSVQRKICIVSDSEISLQHVCAWKNKKMSPCTSQSVNPEPVYPSSSSPKKQGFHVIFLKGWKDLYW